MKAFARLALLRVPQCIVQRSIIAYKEPEPCRIPGAGCVTVPTEENDPQEEWSIWLPSSPVGNTDWYQWCQCEAS